MKNKVVNVVILDDALKFRMFVLTVHTFVFCLEVTHGAYV